MSHICQTHRAGLGEPLSVAMLLTMSPPFPSVLTAHAWPQATCCSVASNSQIFDNQATSCEMANEHHNKANEKHAKLISDILLFFTFVMKHFSTKLCFLQDENHDIN